MVGLYQLFYWVELGKIEFYCIHFDIFDRKSIKKVSYRRRNKNCLTDRGMLAQSYEATVELAWFKWVTLWWDSSEKMIILGRV